MGQDGAQRRESRLTGSARQGVPSRIGNDVLDLQHPKCLDRRRDGLRFKRVLTPDEREWVVAGPSDDALGIRLWALWAAKEAAFKVHCKLHGTERFRPRRFRCRLEYRDEDEGSMVRIRGQVQREESQHRVTVEGSSNRQYLHLVGWSGVESRPQGGRIEIGLEEFDPEFGAAELASLRDHFTPEEWAGIRSFRSAKARILARERIEEHLDPDGPAHLGETESRVEIRTGSPTARSRPHIWFDNEEVTGLDLSLSHHGRFVAWALLVPEGA